jgi:tetratricopeptide (TPR) repeat protein
MPGLGKTYLARQFIRRHAALFDGVYEVDCRGKGLAAITGSVGEKIGIQFEGDAVAVAARQKQWLEARRCLLYLDNVENNDPAPLIPEGRASVLVTANGPSIDFLALAPPIALQVFGPDEAHALFSSILAKTYDRPLAEAVFQKLGYLPLGIAVTAGTLRQDKRFSLEQLAKDLPPLSDLRFAGRNLGDWFGRVIGALDEEARRLLQAMACCAANGFQWDFASEVNGGASRDALNRLLWRSLVDDLGAERYRVHALIRRAADPPAERKTAHAQAVEAALERLKNDPLRAETFLDEAREVVGRAEDSWLIAGVANRAGHCARNVGRLQEAFEFYRRVREIANRMDEQDWLQTGLGNQALILQAWGRLDEAMELHQQEEKICRELGDRAGLQASLGNQALILRAWGRLDEAMELHQQEEKICRELGDRAGLAYSLLNQATVVQARGDRQEAGRLTREALVIFRELRMPRETEVAEGNLRILGCDPQ